MKSEINIGVIGLGSIAQIAHIPNWIKVDGAKIKALCDNDIGKAQGIANKYGIEYVFSDYKELLNRKDIDAIDICVPNYAHYPIIIDAIKAKKHIIVEKPIAFNYEEIKHCYEEAEKSNLILMVGMNNRFRYDSIYLKDIVQKKELGEVIRISAGWYVRNNKEDFTDWRLRKNLAGGGAWMELGEHLFDVIMWILNYPKVLSVSSVFTFNSYISNEVESSCSTLIRIENDVPLVIQVDWNYPGMEGRIFLNMVFENGIIRIFPFKVFKKTQTGTKDITPDLMDTEINMYKSSYFRELNHFIQTIKGYLKLIPKKEEILMNSKITRAIYLSAETKKEVILNE